MQSSISVKSITILKFAKSRFFDGMTDRSIKVAPDAQSESTASIGVMENEAAREKPKRRSSTDIAT